MTLKEDKMQWFRNARFGMFIHWGIYSIPAKGEWALFHNNWDYNYYDQFAEQFNPVNFDPGQWAELAWNAGMRYVVFTTKHHDGYCMFDSKYTDYKITNSPYGKDITAELVAAFRERGLKIGLYHSLVDWRHPHFIPDEEHPAWRRGERDFSNRDIRIYREYLYKSVRQLLTGYGKIDLLFFDYTSKYKTSEEWEAEKMLELVYSLQPEIIVNDRLTHEKGEKVLWDYLTPEISVPNRQTAVNGRAYDWETCMTMNTNWGYCEDDHNYKSVDTILQALIKCVSLNGNLLLNVGPDSLGRLPERSVRIMDKLAAWLEVHSGTVRGAGKADHQAPYGLVYTQRAETVYLHLFSPPMGDIILPGLNGKVKSISVLADETGVPMITHWGAELLDKTELRIRPPANLPPMSVLKIELSEG